MNWGDGMERTISEAIETLIGDTPVAKQLDAALSDMASKNHTHDNYVDRKDFEALKQQVESLLQLVGDISVADQIRTAINSAKR
jgi:hypothetical protein